MSGKTKGRGISPEEKQLVAAVTELTDVFCKEFLNDEYAALCRKLTAVLCQEWPTLLTKGKLSGWAAGIVYTIGRVNFLGDPSQDPHMRLGDIAPHFGVSPATAAARARDIQRHFDIMPLDPNWCLPSRMDDNPLAWIVQVNGFLIDARMAPRAIQEEAFRKGLIPYLPEVTTNMEA